MFAQQPSAPMRPKIANRPSEPNLPNKNLPQRPSAQRHVPGGPAPLPVKEAAMPKFKIVPGAPIPEFLSFEYIATTRDPFISPDSDGTIVKAKAVTPEPENPETLELLLNRLKQELATSTRVLGVSLDPSKPDDDCALVQFEIQVFGVELPPQPGELPPGTVESVAPGQPGPTVTGAAAAASAEPAELPPPISVSKKEGFPIRVPRAETSYVFKLAAKIAVESGQRLLRDTTKSIIYLPIQAITEKGIYIAPIGAESAILLENAGGTLASDVRSAYEIMADQQTGPLPPPKP